MRWFASLVPAAALMACPVPGVAQQPEPLFVGLLRNDCVALPFAAFDGVQWERVSAPPEAMQKDPFIWRFLPRSGVEVELRSDTLVRFEDEMGGDAFYETWGIATNHRPCTPAGGSYPTPRIGVVLSAAAPSRPFRIVPGGEIDPRLAATIRRVFDQQEETRIREDTRPGQLGRTLRGHPRDSSVRQQSPATLTSVYRSTRGDSTYLHFEARRDYPPPTEDAPFRPLTVMHGWARTHAGGITLQNVEVQLDNGSEMEVRTCTPFALVVLKDMLYVIAERGEWESSEKQVLHWDLNGLVPVLPRDERQ